VAAQDELARLDEADAAPNREADAVIDRLFEKKER
jgi:hypothetical protein